MKRKTLATVIAILTASVLLLTACGGNGVAPPAADDTPPEVEADADTDTEAPAEDTDATAPDEIELRFTWWGGDERAQRTQTVIDMFMEENPHIRIVGEPRPGDAYWDNLVVQLEGGSAPDIMQFGGNLQDFIAYLEPLETFVGDVLHVGSADEFDQGVLETGTIEGDLYGISLGTNFLVLAVNRTMLEEAGAPLPQTNTWTWDDMIAYGEEIRDLLPDGVFPFVDNSVNQTGYLSYFMGTRGEPIWTAEHETHATLEGFLAWVDLWEDMREAGLIPDIETTAAFTETAVDNSALVAGRAAIGLIWSNQIGAYQDSMTDELIVAHLPVGDVDAFSINVSQFLAVNGTSPYQREAAMFIDFFVNNAEAGEVLGTDRGIPSSPTVRETIAPRATELDSILYLFLDEVVGRSVPQAPNLPNDQEFVDTIRIIGQSVSFEVLTREEGAQDMFDLTLRLMSL